LHKLSRTVVFGAQCRKLNYAQPLKFDSVRTFFFRSLHLVQGNCAFTVTTPCCDCMSL